MAFIGAWMAFSVGLYSTSVYLEKITDTLKPCNEDLFFYWLCYFIYDLCQYPAALVLVILYSMMIIQGLLLSGVIDEKKCGFLTPWLFVSFIAIIGLAVNFGYVSLFTGLPYIYIHNE